jgi:hypothetical protein
MTTETTAIALRDRSDEIDLLTLGDILARSGYFNDAKEAAQCIVKVLAGRELGFGPVASMSGIHIIQGKPTLSANLIAAAIKRSRRYNYRVKRLDSDACVIEFFELDNGRYVSIGESSFTVEDARAAGALDGRNKHSWHQFRRNMLFARAISNGARWFCPDIFGGPVYTPEELGAQTDEDGHVLLADNDDLVLGEKADERALSATTIKARDTTDRAEAMRELRSALIAEIEAVGQELGYSRRVLDAMANRRFEVTDGLDSLSPDYLQIVLDGLRTKLADRREYERIRTEREEHSQAALD